MSKQMIKYGKARLDCFSARKVQWISKDSTRKMKFVVRAGIYKIGA